jgi:SulP family sulfate permease
LSAQSYSHWSRFIPKSVVCFKEGYTREGIVRDLIAGVTVGIIALPLAMAFGIASIPEKVASEAGLSPPAIGLYTAVVAGFLVSLLSGSRVQIGGPTGAFIVIIYSVASRHGYNGLATATLMAGVIVIVMGLSRFGAMIKFIPYPVTTGFTTGIAVIIFSSQIRDFFGLRLTYVLPPGFVGKLHACGEHYATLQPSTVAIGAAALAILILCRRLAPRVPGAIVAVIVTSLAVWLFKLPADTIGERFGSIPHTLPLPRLPVFSLTLIRDVIPDAMTIAMLIAIESLLSAVVADGMTGQRHKADCELVAQGVGNIAAVLFGGIPATGAIARTAANIKSGGRTPLAGIIHAVMLLLCMALLAPLAGRIPLATLAAMLMMVAWNMAMLDHFRYILRAPGSDIVVLLTTFGLTVFADLTIAVGVGMVLASMLFMKRMSDVSGVNAITRELDSGGEEDELGQMKDPNAVERRQIPAGVEVYEINGPFFFGVADQLKDTLREVQGMPKVFILRMRRVPSVDATGLHALKEFHHKCGRNGIALLLAGVHAQPLFAFLQVGFDKVIGRENMFENFDGALNRARAILGLPPQAAPADTVPEVAREVSQEAAEAVQM